MAVQSQLPLNSTLPAEQTPEKGGPMRVKFLMLVLVATLSLPILAMGQSASYNFAQGVNFSIYKTYEWVDISGAGASNSFLDAQIKQAINAQLAAKGFTKTNQGAQLYVAYQVSFAHEKEIKQYMRGGAGGRGPGWEYFCSFGAMYGGPTLSVENNATIQFGNLVLDFYDSASKDLLWRGNVSKAFNSAHQKQTLDKAAAKLLKSFPPKTKY
jgi:hypothetical protein